MLSAQDIPVSSSDPVEASSAMATDSRLAIWLICGGQSPEHDISVSSGRTAVKHLNLSQYAVTPAYIRRNGMWSIAQRPLAEDDDAAAIVQGLMDSAVSCDIGEAIATARRAGVAVALLILHGACGEDGTIQGLLELAGIPYTGSGVLASSLAMDKVRCQRFLGGCGLPVSPFVFVEDAVRHAAQLAAMAAEEIGLPCVVKPSRAGSSVGVSIVRDRAQLPSAIQAAAKIDPLVMVENYVAGEEVTCGVIQTCQDFQACSRALAVTAIRPRNSAFFDYVAKYSAGQCEEITPAPISDSDAARIMDLSLRAFELLGCRDMARVDFILSPQMGPRLLEVNTIPGLTPTSLLPQQAAYVGMSFSQLLDTFIQNAAARRLTPQGD